MAAALSPADLEAWGWRIPLAFGCLIVPLLFLMRRDLKESEAFQAAIVRPSLAQTLAGLWRARGKVAAGVGPA